MGFGGDFLRMLQAMYTDDSVKSTVNGSTTRSVFLGRGLRQGCSLSPLLFALYVSGLGEDLCSSGEGFMVGNVMISSLFFADDVLLVASSAPGLKRLFRIVKSGCDKLLLEINTDKGKSEVISPVDDFWDILGENGNVELSLRQVLVYKYLGLETTSSIFKTGMAKRAKCLEVANDYKFACLHLGKRGPDVVDVTLATWNNIAIPSILFGCESIIFKECTVAALERIQSKVAKSLLGVPSNTVNVCAQSELGMLPFRMLLYKCQLKFYFRVLELPESRWVKQALLDHLSLQWSSPYLDYITDIRVSVHLPFVPPTPKYLAIHLVQWALAETNQVIENHSLPFVSNLTKFARQPYVYEHNHLDTIAQFRLSNAGLGNRFPGFPADMYDRRTFCPLCPSLRLTESHVVFFCSAVESHRKELDLVFFRNICKLKGYSEEETFSTFINGLDWNGNLVQDTDYAERGLALDTIRGHWVARG